MCVCVFFCFALGCWVMGPAGRAEAIHFPSATLKAASREGGREQGGRENKTEEKKRGRGGGWDVYVLLRRDREGAIAIRWNRKRLKASAEK